MPKVTPQLHPKWTHSPFSLQAPTQVHHILHILSSQDNIESVTQLDRHLAVSTYVEPQVMCVIVSYQRPHFAVSEHWYSLCRVPAKQTYKHYFIAYYFHFSKATQWRRASLWNFDSDSIIRETWAHLRSSGSLETLLKSGRNEIIIS